MEIQKEILNELGVTNTESFEPENEIQKRVNFLAEYLRNAGKSTYVLGISGGVDSTTAGKLAQLAVNRLCEEGYPAKFIAVRLPYGIQKDEVDAQNALDFICPTVVKTINIKEAVDAQMKAYDTLNDHNHNLVDFSKGNVKARQRMISQYLVANLENGIVIGTDHSAEAVTGFYTIHGDGAADILPLSKLNKRQVRLLAQTLGAPKSLFEKAATADLEDLKEQLPDEVALGVTYEEIDDYLEGKPVRRSAAQTIEKRFDSTRFKRRLPLSF